jgi:hypothetical protein
MTHNIRITYEVITEESAKHGDTADNGWIHPETELRRSLTIGGNRMRERNIRMARAGKFNWTLRDAIKFIDSQCCAEIEGDDGDIDRLYVRAMGEYYSQAYQGEQVNYGLHIEGVSSGTVDRLARVLRANGVRFYGG